MSFSERKARGCTQKSQMGFRLPSFDVATGIKWHALTRSNFENTATPHKIWWIWFRFGTGYLSGMVTELTRRWSPQERHEPSAFLIIWRAEAHGLDGGRTIPRSSNIANSLFARSNFAGDNGLGLQNRGGPFI